MKRAILVVCVVVLVALAGCSSGDGGGEEATTSDPSRDGGGGGDGGGSDGGSSDGGSDESGGSADGSDEAGDGGASTTSASTGGGASSVPEIQMLQFDRTETYEYETVAYGQNGTMTVSVELQSDEAVVTVEGVTGQSEAVNEYVVPTNDPEAVEDAMSDDIRDPGMVFVLQSRDASNIFVTNDVPFEVGASYEDAYGNITVTGEDTIAGVDCLTYEFYVSDTLAETGCLSERLEVPVMWEKYDGEDGVRLSIRLVAYEEGNSRFVGHAIGTKIPASA